MTPLPIPPSAPKARPPASPTASESLPPLPQEVPAPAQERPAAPRQRPQSEQPRKRLVQEEERTPAPRPPASQERAAAPQPPEKKVVRDARWKNYYTRLYPKDLQGKPKRLSKADEERFRERIDKLCSAPRTDPKNPMKNFDNFLETMREGRDDQ